MKTFLYVLQIVLAVLLIAAILVQSRGSGLGAAFGGGGAVYRTKRGAEKIIFRLTIIVAVLFFITAIATVFLV